MNNRQTYNVICFWKKRWQKESDNEGYAKYAEYAKYVKYAKYAEYAESKHLKGQLWPRDPARIWRMWRIWYIWDIEYNLPISPTTLFHINNYPGDLSSPIWCSTTTRATVMQQIKLINSGRVSIILTIVNKSQYFWQQWSSFNTFDNSGRVARCVGNEKCPPHQSGAPSKQGHFKTSKHILHFKTINTKHTLKRSKPFNHFKDIKTLFTL